MHYVILSLDVRNLGCGSMVHHLLHAGSVVVKESELL